MGIVVVFFIGLIKLWVSNRHMRRLEQLDAERQTRMAQVKKSGLSSNGKYRFGSDIPFGVKALESNIEVDGIWVVRMASMASRPPERKWSSMRKVRSSPAASSLANANNSSGSRKSQRGSKRASKISRSEIVVPSAQTRNKLENLSLLEEEGDWRDLAAPGRESLQAEEQPSRRYQPAQGGTLGKIQRGIKRMTSTETWQAGESKKGLSTQAFGVKEFREGAQARTPQRFYPPTTTAAMPLVEPQENERQRPRHLVKKQSATRQQHQNESRSSSRSSQFSARLSSTGSVEKAEERTSTGRPRIPTRVSSESARASISTREQGAHWQSRRNSRESQNDSRRSSDKPREMATHGLPRSTGSTNRYPPNSSRSGGANPPRSRSFS